MKKNLQSLLCLFLAVLLTAAVLTGCSKPAETPETTAAPTQNAPATEAKPGETGETTLATKAVRVEPTELGETGKLIYFDVTFADGGTASYAIHTEDDNVGDALLKWELVEGSMESYGLYVKTINGETHDYNTDGSYWAFYIDGEYAMTGVSDTPITEGARYAFKAEQG